MVRRMAEERLQPLSDQFAKVAPQRFSKEVRPLVELCPEPPARPCIVVPSRCEGRKRARRPMTTGLRLRIRLRIAMAQAFRLERLARMQQP